MESCYGGNMQYFSTKEIMSLSAKTCDRCNIHAESGDFEFHEFMSIEHIAGYGSVFGDGETLQLDLCQHCVKTVLGQWIK